MAKILQGTPVSAPITPGSDDTNVWPTHYAKYGAGGFQVVADLAARDAIATERRTDKGVLILDSDGQGAPLMQSWNGSTWDNVNIGNANFRVIDKDNAVEHGVTGIKFAKATISMDNGSVLVTPEAAELLKVVDKDGTETTDVTSVKFKEGVISTDSNGNTVVSIPVATGSSINVTDSFDKTLITNDLKFKNMSVITEENGQAVIDIETGIRVTGKDGNAVDGNTNLEFPQATFTHDSQTGASKLEFDLSPKGVTVQDKAGTVVSESKHIIFDRALVTHDTISKTTHVVTQTGVDVGADNQVFNGVERINFNDSKANLVHDDGSLYITPQLKFADKKQVHSDDSPTGTQDTYQGTSNKVDAYPPLQLQGVIDDDGIESVRLDIDPYAFEHQHAEAYLGYSAYPASIIQGLPQDTNAKGFLWLDEEVYKPSKYIVPNKSTKSFTLKKDGDDGMLENYYYVACKVNIGEAAQNDGTVAVSVVNGDDVSVVIKDSSNKDLSKQMNVVSGQTPGDFYVDGIVTITADTKLMFEVSSTVGDLTISGKATGLTGVIIQKLTATESTSPALQQWSSDTGIYPMITTYPVVGNVLELPAPDYLKAEGLTDGKTHAKDKQFKLLDGWNIYSNSTYVTRWDTDGYLFIDDTPFAYVGAVLDSVRTKFIANDGQKVGVTTDVKAYQPDIWLIMAKWTGDADKPIFPIASGLDADDHVIYNSGWSQVSYETITADASGSSNKVTSEFTIPFDAENVAFIMVPSTKTAADTGNGPGLQLGVKEMSVQSKSDSKIHFKLEHASADTQVYKTVTGIEQQVGGIVQVMPIGTTPWAITPHVTGMDIFEDGKAPVTFDATQKGLLFQKAGAVRVDFMSSFNVKIKVNGLVYTNDGQGGIRFYAELFDKDLKSKGIIKASKRYIWLPEHHGSASPEVSFPTTVEEGDLIRFYAVADKDNVVEIVYLPGVAGDPNSVFMAGATYLSKSRVVTSNVSTGNVVNPAPVVPNLELDQFDEIYTFATTAVKLFTNVSSAKIPLTVPDGADLVVLSAVKKLPDGTVRPVAKLDYLYLNNELTISFGETATVKVTLAIYA